MKIHIDFETYSEAKIKDVGAWQYARDPSTEVICMAYTEGEEVKLWTPKDPVPAFVTNPKTQLHAWNSFFELCVWTHVLRWPTIPIEQWADTAALAAAMAMPRALGDCAKALGLPADQQKDKRGRYLIQRLCQPVTRQGTKVRLHDEDLLQELYDYCKQDVVTERAIAARLPDLHPRERRVWELDQVVNIRGVPLDADAVDACRLVRDAAVPLLNAQVQQVTHGALTGTTSRADVLHYCESQGYALEGYTKDIVDLAVNDPDCPRSVRAVLQVRQQTGRTSVAKLDKMRNLIDPDTGSVHGCLLYHGATTGRWTSRLIQLQNLPRGDLKDPGTCIDIVKQYQDEYLIECLYGDTMAALSSSIRGLICAQPGHRLLVADYAQIEARVLPWLAGQRDILDVFAQGQDVYRHAAGKMYNKPADEISSDERQVGKVATLALGYAGGAKAFIGMARDLDIDEERAEEIKHAWRAANTRIVQHWYDIDEAAQRAISTGKAVRCGKVTFNVVGDWLVCRLPSTRCIAWYKPHLTEGKYGREQVAYWGTDRYTRKWSPQRTYGGDLVQSITQATARDVMSDAMLRVEAAGYPVSFTVHDEIVCHVPSDQGSPEEMFAIMREAPGWAAGLPIDVDGFEAQRYRK